MRQTSDHVVVAEVAAAILVVGGAIALSARPFCLPGVGVHPLWIPILVFASRYGARGLFIALAMSAVALGAASLAEHGTLVDLAQRGDNTQDVIALVAATLVAWTAMMRDRRLARVSGEQREMARRLTTSVETASALRDAIAVLRDRLDRIDLSITMWRTIAGRIDNGPLPDAAAAALELASIRSGAAAGVVKRRRGGRLETVATYGHAAGASDLGRDRTVLEVLAQRRPILRKDVPASTLDDSEVAIPIVDPETGVLLGVIAMREAPRGRLRAAEVRDLEVVAAWLAGSFPRPQVRAGGTAC